MLDLKSKMHRHFVAHNLIVLHIGCSVRNFKPTNAPQ